MKFPGSKMPPPYRGISPCSVRIEDVVSTGRDGLGYAIEVDPRNLIRKEYLN